MWGKYKNIFFSEAIALIEPKLCINHWKVLYKFCVFYVDRNSKMTTTAGHSFYIGPIGSFYNQVIYLPCNFEVNHMTHFGVIALIAITFRLSVNISHFNLLLRNHRANCNQTLVEWSLDGSLPKICPLILTSNQDVRQAENRKRGDEILIVRCCFSISQNELKFNCSYMARSSLTHVRCFCVKFFF